MSSAVVVLFVPQMTMNFGRDNFQLVLIEISLIKLDLAIEKVSFHKLYKYRDDRNDSDGWDDGGEAQSHLLFSATINSN